MSDELPLPYVQSEIESQKKFQAPRILERLIGEGHIKYEQHYGVSDGLRMTTSIETNSIEYDLTVVEDSEFIMLESKIAQIEPNKDMYALLHDINADTYEGKVIVDREVEVEVDGRDGTQIQDEIFFTKHIRKVGVPDGTIAEGFVEYNHGISRVFTEFRSAADALGVSFQYSEVDPGRRDSNETESAQAARISEGTLLFSVLTSDNDADL